MGEAERRTAQKFGWFQRALRLGPCILEAVQCGNILLPCPAGVTIPMEGL